MQDWQTLTQMTGADALVIERVGVPRTGVRIEGAFELPPLARLTYEDQVFVAAFVRAHGSIKAMEASFGISYPTVKNRLHAIAEQLGFVAAEPGDETPATTAPSGGSTETKSSPTTPQAARLAVLDALSQGRISAAQAAERLGAI